MPKFTIDLSDHHAQKNQLPVSYHSIKNANEIQDFSSLVATKKENGVHSVIHNGTMTSKTGFTINCPKWLINCFPDDIKFHAELVYQDLQGSIALAKSGPTAKKWQQAKLYLFDCDMDCGYLNRLGYMKKLHKTVENLQVVKPFFPRNYAQLQALFDDITEQGGEGLVIRYQDDNYFKTGKTNRILKLKKRQDSEATIIAVEKDIESLCLVCQWQGKKIRITTGFKKTDMARPKNYWLKNEIVFSYFEQTRDGYPIHSAFEALI